MTATAEINNKKNTRRTNSPYPADFVAEVVEYFKKGHSTAKTSKKFNICTATVLNWAHKNGATIRRRGRPVASETKNKIHPTVSKVIKAINNERAGGEAYSLASDFGISEKAESREPSAPAELNLSYCPCCGTNIKAVMIALQTVKEMK
jgi:transposase-like protein